MARKAPLDRAIEKIDQEIAQLQAIRVRLVNEAQTARPKRKPTSKPVAAPRELAEGPK